MKSFKDNAHLTPEFKPGDAVFTLSFRRADSTWVPGVILSVLSPVNYQVQVEDVVWKRHRNQLRLRSVPLSELKEQSSSPRLTLEQLPRPVMQQRTPDQPTQQTPPSDRPTQQTPPPQRPMRDSGKNSSSMSQSSTQPHSQSQQQRCTTVSSPRPRTQSTENASKQITRSGHSIMKPARFRDT